MHYSVLLAQSGIHVSAYCQDGAEVSLREAFERKYAMLNNASWQVVRVLYKENRNREPGSNSFLYRYDHRRDIGKSLYLLPSCPSRHL